MISGFDKSFPNEENLGGNTDVVTPEIHEEQINYSIKGFDKSSPLEEQINNIKGTQITTNNTRSSRGLNINKKCNLCTLKKQEQNANITAYDGDSLATY